MKTSIGATSGRSAHEVPGRALGIWSFVLSFVVQVLGLIFGIVALAQSRRAGVSNNFAVAGVIMQLGSAGCRRDSLDRLRRSWSGGMTPPSRPTVILVHGAFADASCFGGVIRELTCVGYDVLAPPNPLRGVSTDAATVRAVAASIQGPVVLVGHSYGGAVITQASADLPNVGRPGLSGRLRAGGRARAAQASRNRSRPRCWRARSARPPTMRSVPSGVRNW